MQYTSTVLFSGAGLMDFAIQATGGRIVQAVEWDEKIAAQYHYNFPSCRLLVQSVQSVRAENLEPTHHIHLSPPCTEASIANSKATETELSISAAIASLNIIQSIHQRGGAQYITLENVWGYRNFASFLILLNGLRSLGYVIGYQKLNAADFGTPQNRERLWLRAALPVCAPANQQLNLFGHHALLPLSGFSQRVSWWQAIAPRVPELPLTTLAKWQIKRLPSRVKDTILINGAECTAAFQRGTRPAFHPECIRGGSGLEATSSWVGRQNGRNEKPWQPANHSSFTLSARPNLKILLGKEKGQAASACLPSFTITSTVSKQLPVLLKRAGANATDQPIEATEPAPTVRAMGGRSDQFDLLHNWEVRRLTPEALWILQMYGCDKPYHWSSGTPNTIKCRGIGNGVAFLNAVSVLKSLIKT